MTPYTPTDPEPMACPGCGSEHGLVRRANAFIVRRDVTLLPTLEVDTFGYEVEDTVELAYECLDCERIWKSPEALVAEYQKARAAEEGE